MRLREELRTLRRSAHSNRPTAPCCSIALRIDLGPTTPQVTAMTTNRASFRGPLLPPLPAPPRRLTRARARSLRGSQPGHDCSPLVALQIAVASTLFLALLTPRASWPDCGVGPMPEPNVFWSRVSSVAACPAGGTLTAGRPAT